MAIVNPSETKAILRKHNIRLTKKLGQHFLIDGNILAKEIEEAGLTKHDTVLEIGPGIGTLTEALAERAGQVVAIEYDRRFIGILGETLKDRDNVRVVEADALKADLSSYGAKKMVSNLPYNVGTAVLLRILKETPEIVSMTVMLQTEVARRLTASPGSKDYGPLSITVSCYGNTRISAAVKPSAFLPAPDVDSSIVTVTRRPEPLFGAATDDFLDFVRILFQPRRKTLKRAVAMASGLTSGQAAAVAGQAGLSAESRAETLSPAELFELYRAVNSCKC